MKIDVNQVRVTGGGDNGKKEIDMEKLAGLMDSMGYDTTALRAEMEAIRERRKARETA